MKEIINTKSGEAIVKEYASIICNAVDRLKTLDVNDESSYQVALDEGRALNKLSKDVDKRRKELEKPHKDEAKKISSAVKELMKPVDPAIKELKSKMHYWAMAEKRKREEAERLIIEERERKDNDAIAEAQKESEEYQDIMDLFTAAGSSDLNINKENEVLLNIKSEINKKESDDALKKLRQEKTKGEAKRWGFEIVSKSLVPEDLKEVVSKKVREEMKRCIVDGEVIQNIPGIKFVEESSIRL